MANTISFNRTRIAPTPSGFLHVGNILSFALTAALAIEAGAAILLRIDDMDRQRYRSAYVQDIFEALRFLEIPWHEGPRNLEDFEQHFAQSHRLPLYENALTQLQDKHLLFACKCSRAMLRQDGRCTGDCADKNISLNDEHVAWRLMWQPCAFALQTVEKGVIEARLPDDMQYFVVRKKDGNPAYQLSSLIDDAHFGVDFVVRGNDLWSSSLAQRCLAEVLHLETFKRTVFYHHPLITGRNGEKLSKSAGDTSLRHIRMQGASRAEVFTSIAALMGVNAHPENYTQLADCLWQAGVVPPPY
ncbi:MAG: glutamate--tRNA ligase family protein [Niabella sp.]